MSELIALGAHLPAEEVRLLSVIGREAQSCGLSAYLVGGIVRDILLNALPADRDIDIMVVGDAISFAKLLRERWAEIFPNWPAPDKVIRFQKYGTAKFPFTGQLLPGIDVIDFSSARSEKYPTPGGIPEIETGDLEADIKRRDYSVNALAILLAPSKFGELVDLVDGRADVLGRTLRVLHDQSFVDDPARLIRGVRFQVRYGLAFEAQTKALFDAAIKGEFIYTLPPRRLHDELEKARNDAGADAIFAELEKCGLMRQVRASLN